MKKNFAILVLIFFSLFGICCRNGGTENRDNGKNGNVLSDKEITFRVVITNFYFGHPQYVTTVTSDSLISAKDDFNGKHSLTSRKLSGDESAKIISFMKNFSLDSLKDKYVNPGVEDGTQMGFTIKINSVEKNIYVANVFQRNLGELTKIVSGFLPEDYIMYNEKAVPFEENKEGDK